MGLNGHSADARPTYPELRQEYDGHLLVRRECGFSGARGDQQAL
jgi:hypothetical protein